MTFSDEKIIRFVNQHFVAAWESVAPVSIATFDLGNGKKLTGAYGGNIALYLCDSDGRVLDILPALQTPTVTLGWLRGWHELLTTLRDADADTIVYAVRAYHARRAEQPDLPPARAAEALHAVVKKSGAVLYSRPPDLEPAGRPDPAPKPPLEAMVGKSMAAPSDGGRILVVVAGGLTTYRKEIDRYLASGPARTPAECAKHVFESVLGEKLEGRRDVFVTDDPTSIAVPDED